MSVDNMHDQNQNICTFFRVVSANVAAIDVFLTKPCCRNYDFLKNSLSFSKFLFWIHKLDKFLYSYPNFY